MANIISAKPIFQAQHRLLITVCRLFEYYFASKMLLRSGVAASKSTTNTKIVPTLVHSSARNLKVVLIYTVLKLVLCR